MLPRLFIYVFPLGCRERGRVYAATATATTRRTLKSTVRYPRGPGVFKGRGIRKGLSQSPPLVFAHGIFTSRFILLPINIAAANAKINPGSIAIPPPTHTHKCYIIKIFLFGLVNKSSAGPRWPRGVMDTRITPGHRCYGSRGSVARYIID